MPRCCLESSSQATNFKNTCTLHMCNLTVWTRKYFIKSRFLLVPIIHFLLLTTIQGLATQETLSKSKALKREVEPYGFFLVNALREYHYALGRGLLTIASALFRLKCDQTKCDIRKGQNIFFLLLRLLLGI